MSSGPIPMVSGPIAAAVIATTPVAVSDVNVAIVDDGAAVPTGAPIVPAPPATTTIDHCSDGDPDAERNDCGTPLRL